MLDGGFDVLVFAFGFDDGDRNQTNEKHIVGGSASGGPLGDGQIAALLWAHPFGVSVGDRVGLPTRLAQLFVDQLPGRYLIKFKSGGGRLGFHLLNLGGGLGGGLFLELG